MQVLDFNKKLEEKKQEQERRQGMEHMQYLLARMTHNQKLQVMEAIETSNMDLWKEVTDPIVMRKVMREIN